MSNKQNHEVIGEGEKCPKCSIPMERREHRVIKDKQRKALYYFKEWDYCVSCQHVQHYEHCKVFNSKNKVSQGEARGQMFRDFERLIAE